MGRPEQIFLESEEDGFEGNPKLHKARDQAHMAPQLDTTTKKKVGVVTFHRSANYGAVLQAYALQKYLVTMGYAPSLIDYVPGKCPKKKLNFAQRCANRIAWLLQPKFIATALVNRMHARLCSNKQTQLRVLCREFIQQHTQIDAKPYFSDGRWKIDEQYVALITGSDQVWSIRWGELDDVYFLNIDSGSNRRIAYAPSLGGLTFPITLAPKIRAHLSKFHMLSVRERSSISEVSAYTEKQVVTVPDPVFLIDPPHFSGTPDLNLPSRYILVYRLSQSLSQSVELSRMIRIAEDRLGLPVIRICPDCSYPLPCSWEALPDPIEFVRLINGATLVITNSFHGMALSLIHQTNAFASPRDAHGGTQDARLYDLLIEFGLEHHFVTDSRNFKDQLQNGNPIDWRKVDVQRLILKQSGIDFLTRALEN